MAGTQLSDVHQRTQSPDEALFSVSVPFTDLGRYLHNNSLSRIENLAHLKRLHTLNISHNRLTSLDGLEGCDSLRTLDVSGNMITDINECRVLKLLPALGSFDARDNKIDNHEDIVPFFAELPRLELLYLRGNPCVRKIVNYRKVMITTIPALVYFDERNVEPLDRMFAEAYMRGGKDEELKVRDEYAEGQRKILKKDLEIAKQIEQDKQVKRKEAFKQMMEKVKQEKAELLTRRERLEKDVA